jgi:hypothetical protein
MFIPPSFFSGYGFIDIVLGYITIFTKNDKEKTLKNYDSTKLSLTACHSIPCVTETTS